MKRKNDANVRIRYELGICIRWALHVQKLSMFLFLSLFPYARAYAISTDDNYMNIFAINWYRIIHLIASFLTKTAQSRGIAFNDAFLKFIWGESYFIFSSWLSSNGYIDLQRITCTKNCMQWLDATVTLRDIKFWGSNFFRLIIFWNSNLIT